MQNGVGRISAEDCRRYAAECLDLARKIGKSDDKARLLEIAERWRELAERLADRRGQRP